MSSFARHSSCIFSVSSDAQASSLCENKTNLLLKSVYENEETSFGLLINDLFSAMFNPSEFHELALLDIVIGHSDAVFCQARH